MKPVSGKRLGCIFDAAGVDAGRINGGHHIYRHPSTGRRTSVPVHVSADLKPGTQRGIMRDAGLADDDL